MIHGAVRIVTAILAAWACWCPASSAASAPPNVLIVLVDDLGYGDLSIHGSPDVRTPHIDSIARNGARCSDGYVAAPVCAPSRAGLLTGRHPERFGFQGNPARGARWGLPLDESTLADELKRLGYATSCIGKWHLGETDALHPLSRGFNEFFGFLSGMHSYFAAEDPQWGPVLRSREPAAFEGYLTDVFATEATGFIRRHTAQPWFLYLSFNGVHTPMAATAEKLAAFADIGDERRRTYAAMLSSVDDAVGAVLESLRETGQEERTLVFFLSDNGGAKIKGSAPNGATNGSLRGGKLQLWEGGIRVPFFVQWKSRIPAGRVVPHPVTALDILPTALAAAGSTATRGDLDGRDLVPVLTGASDQPVHDRLLWRFYGRAAVREGDWKWVRESPTEQGIFRVATDVSEEHDQRAAEAARAAALEKHWRQWADTLPPPIDPATRHERPPRSAAAGERPNVVLLIADDVSWDDWGCYGNAAARTPHIDALAARGRRFDRAYLTASSCSPSRASIVTGRYPHNCGRAGELHLPIAAHLPWFPALLREAGYFTGLVGKDHMRAEPAADGAQPQPPAFDVVDAGRVPGNSGGHGRWVEALRQRPRDTPFFFWFASYDAHRDWDADAEWRDEAYGPPHDPRRLRVPAPLIDDAATRSDLASYHNEVTRFDHFVGSVVAELERQHVLDDTCIIVMADNGRPFPGAKTRLNEAGMRTPFVVHWPRAVRQPGVATTSLVSAIDVAPTILAAAGVALPATMQGVSFLPVLHDPAATVRNHAFSEQNWHDYEAHGRALRSDGYLYIRNRRPLLGWQGSADSVRSPAHRALLAARQAGSLSAAGADVLLAPRAAEELFRIDDDPEQVRNLAADPAQRAVLAHLRSVLDDWSEATRDSCPERLSRDAYDRETGAALGIPEESFRGTPPGSDRNAAAANAPTPTASTGSCNLVEHGADPTGRRDSTPAFERIVAQSKGARHVQIVIPAGAYRLDRRVLLSATGNHANYGIRITGAGEDVTELLVDNPDGGLAFRGVDLNRLSCTVSDLSLVAVREDAGVALAFDAANPGDHHARQFTAERILIRGERFDRGSFSSGVEVRNAWYPALRDVKVTAPYGPQAASPSPLACGILLEDCYSPLVNECYVWGGRRGLVHRARAKQPEDGIVRDSYFVGSEEGIVVDLTAGSAHWPEPGFHISDCHVNYRDRGVIFKGVRQATIDTTLFYCHDRTGTTWWKRERPTVAGGDAMTPREFEPRDIDLVHASDIVISHNIFTEPANPKRVAIRIGQDSGHVMISANQFNLGGVAIRNESGDPSYSSGNVFGGKPDWAARLVRYEDPAGSLHRIDFSPPSRP